MVDVIVDATPTARAPYDPAVIPDAVRKRAAAIDALYTGSGEVQQDPPVAVADPTPVSAPVQQAQDVPEPTPPVPAPAELAPPPPPPEDENSNTWKSRALSTQGRLEAAKRDLGELQEQYYQEVMRSRQPQRQPQRAQAPAPAPQFLTPEDEANYGRELLDVTQRAALQAVTPQIKALEEQNAELRQQNARDRRRALDQAVELAVPDFRDIDRNPRWHRWLLGIDVLSGRVRQQLLDEAVSAGSAPRVVSFFKSFQNEEAATGHSEPAPTQQPATVAPREAAVPLATLAAPGRGRPASGGESSLPPDKPIYTRAQIAQLYDQHRRGAYVGREAEWARQDADIIAAGREGRIR